MNCDICGKREDERAIQEQCSLTLCLSCDGKYTDKELVEDHNGEWSLDELGVCRDTVIIEIEGGVLKEVHNTPNDYILFDWDNIKEEGETTNKQGELLLILETLEKEI